MSAKPKLAMYWAGSCGGCECALVNIHEVILEVDGHFDFVFCPCLLDTKRADVERLDDRSIKLTLFNGALRTSENLEMAELLRHKSELFIAFGACAATGGIPALANQRGVSEMLQTLYRKSPSLSDPECRLPNTTSQVPEGELLLPALLARVMAVEDAVEVDYSVPGCPPEPEQIIAVIRHVISGKPLPVRGSPLGCRHRSVCDECEKERRDLLADRLVRTLEVLPEPGWCLLEQGLACVGRATRGGCGALCPAANMPCTGCYGPLSRELDPGGAALTSVAAVVDQGRNERTDEKAILERARCALSGIVDPLGTFYRYSLAASVVADRAREAES